MNKHVASLLHKEMTRKEFLTTLGLGIASILGIGNILRFITNQSQASDSSVQRGYGSSTYGH
ncbi:MAG TPA: hypothetical protein VJ836_06985 [Candidatus Saccharimonadales bacterium]|nr:hypothetical protein [Candidatus Saccharimonadales bacterium]